MGALPKNRWLAASTLAIILPLSLLVTFKFTGLIGEPQTPKTITLEPITWKMNKPSEYIVIDDQIENSYITEEVAIIFHVSVFEYREASPSSPFWGKDGLTFGVSVNVSLTKGFAHSLTIKFRPDPNTTIFVHQEWILEAINSTVTEMRAYGTYLYEAYLTASISELSTFLKTQGYLVFIDDYNNEHCANLTLEVTYFSENEYQKVIVPIILQVLNATQSSEG